MNKVNVETIYILQKHTHKRKYTLQKSGKQQRNMYFKIDAPIVEGIFFYLWFFLFLFLFKVTTILRQTLSLKGKRF